MKTNQEKIKWLLNEATQYQIHKTTGIPQSTLSDIKSGKKKIENISFSNAEKLIAYADSFEDNTEAKEVLEKLIEKGVIGDYRTLKASTAYQITQYSETFDEIYADFIDGLLSEEQIKEIDWDSIFNSLSASDIKNIINDELFSK